MNKQNLPILESQYPTILHALQHQCQLHPERIAFKFLVDGRKEGCHLLFQELDVKARKIAAKLLNCGKTGENVLLIYPHGLEIIPAFFGCLYAGMVAIPSPPPDPARLKRTLPRLQSILSDSEATIVLTVSKISKQIPNHWLTLPEFQNLAWLETDTVDITPVEENIIEKNVPDSLAYLQYTSGSTSTPKGVMITHRNVIHHMQYVSHAWNYSADSVYAGWLPYFHDYGLVEGIIHPVYRGIPSYLLSPLTFLKRPYRWLEVISRFRVTHSAAPNFAYDHCCKKVNHEQMDHLELRCWRTAGNAAEPVRKNTMVQFFETFKNCGFQWRAFYPSYGLAEATLVVSAGGPNHTGPKFAAKPSTSKEGVSPESGKPSDDEVSQVVGCGIPVLDMQISIVDPERKIAVREGEIGEIWVKDLSIAQGYWRRPQESKETFSARLSDTDEGPFLRTGDLGFLHGGELYVTGRLKDLIIVAGVNHYPQDIEWTVESCHPAIRSNNACAAFSVEEENKEHLVVVAEISRSFKDFHEVSHAIQQAVSETHEIEISFLVLIKSGSISKTSSGKIQRHSCKKRYLSGNLKVLWSWSKTKNRSNPDVPPEKARFETRMKGSPKSPAKSEIKVWLHQAIGRIAKVKPEEISDHAVFSSFGLGSADAISLVGDLEDWLGKEFSPSILYDYPTVNALSGALSRMDMPSYSFDKVDEKLSEPQDGIAIIGVGCRFPGANNPKEFWELLKNGTDAISEIPSNRWDAPHYYNEDPTVQGKMSTKWGGFLDDPFGFDSQFFEISPKETVSMDPQQRLLMEVAWEALEDSGQIPEGLRGSQSGVFIGISTTDYSSLFSGRPDEISPYYGTGNIHCIAANRISYFLDLKGPSIAIDTACSSSLVAVKLACDSLLSGESDFAISGGVNLLLTPELAISLSQARMMAADGRCKTFDSRADGYVRGEGCGIVILKRLSDALRDQDSIRAVILGGAVNQDGHSNGLTAPNGVAQEEVILKALEKARIRANEVSYIECHGTGTKLGDPQEVHALNTILNRGRNGSHTLLGSVKTNIGHLEAAAGIAGLIKVVLSLVHKQIPPNLHFNHINPHIPIGQTPFIIPTEMRSWPLGYAKCIAGISSFGFGGTNAHLIVEEAPNPNVKLEGRDAENKSEDDQPQCLWSRERPKHILTLSAKTEHSLKQLVKRYSNYFPLHSELRFSDICFSTHIGRSHFDYRISMVADSINQACSQLSAFLENREVEGLIPSREMLAPKNKLVFLFSGQGSQFPGMGNSIYETHPVFREVIDTCTDALRPILEQPLRDVMFGKVNHPGILNETEYTQPALVALEFALFEVWKSWGIIPNAVMGHSIGEYAAASAAGIFRLEECVTMVAKRAQLVQNLPKDGRMVVIFANEEDVAKIIAKACTSTVSIAAINSPQNTVISGTKAEVERTIERASERGFSTHILPISHAFHSALIEPIVENFEEVISEITVKHPIIPMISNLTGDWVVADKMKLNSTYWGRHLREPVQFYKGIVNCIQAEHNIFVEIGPSSSLIGMARQCIKETSVREHSIGLYPSLKKSKDNWDSILESCAKLYGHGFNMNWPGFDAPYQRKLVSLPTYPFEHQKNDLNRFKVGVHFHGKPHASVWNQIVKRVHKHADSLSSNLRINHEQEKFNSLNLLCNAYLAQALKRVNPNQWDNNNLSSTLSFRSDLDFHKQKQHYFLSWFSHLRSQVSSSSSDLNGNKIPSAPEDIAKLRTHVEELWQDDVYLYSLVERCGNNLYEVMMGEIDPITLLFPQGSSSSVGKIYQDSTLGRYFNEVIAKVIEEIICLEVPQGSVRILEIGAGTGGTTSSILPVCPSNRSVYYFTDIGQGFIKEAKIKFGNFPFMRYNILDIERTPQLQGFDLHEFDIVVAGNVVHATRDIKKTLAHVRSLVKPGGYFVVWEATQPQMLLNITFGLLSGWHCFEDKKLRPNSPLLSSDQWSNVLQSRGFSEIDVFPRVGDGGDIWGQHVIVAQTPKTLELGQGLHLSESQREEQPPNQDKTNDLLYELKWELIQEYQGATNIGDNKTTGEDDKPNLWIIFSDSKGVASNISKEIKKLGNVTFFVLHSDCFESCGGNKYTCNPVDKRSFEQVFHEIFNEARENFFAKILFFWGVDAEDSDQTTLKSLHNDQVLLVDSVVHLVQGLVSSIDQSSRAQLWLVTRGAQSISTEDPSSSFVQAMAWGLARVLALEHPQLWGGIIDLDSSSNSHDMKPLVDRILYPSKEDQYVRRNGDWFVPRLVKRTRPLEKSKRLQIRADSTYLITGGFGGIGLRLARFLIDLGARRFILMGRTKLPERCLWRDTISKGGRLATRIRTVLELEQLGASIHIATIDVADSSSLESFIKAFAQESWPPIRGVFHAAGDLSDNSILNLHSKSISKVLRPKVAGTWLLHSLLSEYPLDFFVLFSSASSVLGAWGLGNYAAANAFLDAFATYRQTSNLPAQSIQWGAWNNLGMAARNNVKDQLTKSGIIPFSVDEGLSVLKYILQDQHRQLMAMAIDWEHLLKEKVKTIGMPPMLSKLIPDISGSDGYSENKINSNSNKGCDSEKLLTDSVQSIQAHLQAIVGDILQLEPSQIHVHEPLNSFGFDSIMEVQLRNEAEHRFNKVLSDPQLGDKSIADLAQLLQPARID